MLKSIIFLCFMAIVSAELNDNSASEEESCPRFCEGIEYQCIGGYCYCAAGYIPNLAHNRCIRCPGLGQRCYSRCCDSQENRTLTCWKGFCTLCEEYEDNTWVCPEYDNIFLITSTEIVIGTALVLGVIATFILIVKLCSAVKNLRPLGVRPESRHSIGSLQLYVDERLRDAPPRYSSTAPSLPAVIVPAAAYMNAGFVHDSSIPPPPYTPNKEDDHHNSTNHI